jgi:hypothetical protein
MMLPLAASIDFSTIKIFRTFRVRLYDVPLMTESDKPYLRLRQ